MSVWLNLWASQQVGNGGGEFFIASKTLEADVLVGENQLIFKVDVAFTLTSISIESLVENTGASLIADVNFDLAGAGNSIFAATPANRPTITSGNKTATSGLPDTVDILAGSIIGLSIDQIGSTIAGGDPIIFTFNGAPA